MHDKKYSKVISYDPITNTFAVEVNVIEDIWGDVLNGLAEHDEQKKNQDILQQKMKDKKIIRDYIDYNHK